MWPLTGEVSWSVGSCGVGGGAVVAAARARGRDAGARGGRGGVRGAGAGGDLPVGSAEQGHGEVGVERDGALVRGHVRGHSGVGVSTGGLSVGSADAATSVRTEAGCTRGRQVGLPPGVGASASVEVFRYATVRAAKRAVARNGSYPQRCPRVVEWVCTQCDGVWTTWRSRVAVPRVGQQRVAWRYREVGNARSDWVHRGGPQGHDGGAGQRRSGSLPGRRGVHLPQADPEEEGREGRPHRSTHRDLTRAAARPSGTAHPPPVPGEDRQPRDMVRWWWVRRWAWVDGLEVAGIGAWMPVSWQPGRRVLGRAGRVGHAVRRGERALRAGTRPRCGA